MAPTDPWPKHRCKSVNRLQKRSARNTSWDFHRAGSLLLEKYQYLPNKYWEILSWLENVFTCCSTCQRVCFLQSFSFRFVTEYLFPMEIYLFKLIHILYITFFVFTQVHPPPPSIHTPTQKHTWGGTAMTHSSRLWIKSLSSQYIGRKPEIKINPTRLRAAQKTP